MKKFITCIFVMTTCIFLIGCQGASSEPKEEDVENVDDNNVENVNDENRDKSEENNMSQKDILDFKNIAKAPEATEKHPINEVIKVFFDESSLDAPYEAVAIDIENNEIYSNPIISRSGLRAQDGIIQITEAERVLEILEKYGVQSWQTDYSFEDPESYEDGYSWRLWLQFEDGTVEKHFGKGTEKEKLTPEKFEDFAEELREFVEER